MEIGALNSQSGYLLQVEALPEKDQDVNGLPEDAVPDTESPQPSPTSPETPEQDAADEQDVKGVIRNLQEGHFKGVSDVRLRINFHDELAAIERAQLQTVAEEKIGAVVESVGATVTSLLESGELTEEQYDAVEEFQEAFVQAVNQSKEEFIAVDGPSKDTLVGKLESDFEALVKPLSGALSTSATEEPEEAPAPEDDVVQEPGLVNPTSQEFTIVDGSLNDTLVDGLESLFEVPVEPLSVALSTSATEEPEESVAPEHAAVEETSPVNPADEEQDSVLEPAPTIEPEPNFQTFLENLRSAFITALNEVANGLNLTSVLPELSEPNGNGAAYHKFLSLYNELWGVETSDVASTASEPLDTIA